MADLAERDFEALADDLDRFLGDFFPRRKWQSRVQYDHRAHRFFLDVIVRDPALAGDDRFLSLVAFFGRGRRTMLRERSNLELQCRLFSADGDDLTAKLRSAESSYLDERAGTEVGRRIAWLGFRKRLLWHFVPRSLAWAAAIVVVVAGFGLSISTAIALCFIAVLVQMVLLVALGRRRR